VSEPGPLAGLRVLDFSHVFAGPFCTRSLADMGADVVHVESASRQAGDRYRAAYQHRNKRSIGINLKTGAGQQVAARLAAVADIIVENFSSSVMRRLNLDYASLAPANRRLIYISLSGYGHTGPRSEWLSMNMNLQAYTGLMLMTGFEGDPPTAISNSWNDYIGGLHGIIAIMQALADRVDSGAGRYIDLSQFECSVATVGALLLASAVSGKTPPRLGNRSSDDAPQGVYPCAGDDQWVALTVQTDGQWRALAELLGRSGFLADERLSTAAARMQHHEELDAAIAAWTREQTPAAAASRLQSAGIPAERMRRVADVVDAPDSGAVYRPFTTAGGRSALAATLPFTFGESALSEVETPHEMGADTRDVLRDWLEMNGDEIGALESDRVLV